jgi:hypothetical protein
MVVITGININAVIIMRTINMDVIIIITDIKMDITYKSWLRGVVKRIHLPQDRI